ncbi:MAG: cytochrome C oxidase subunit IV family protein [Actinomycetota bacterium]
MATEDTQVRQVESAAAHRRSHTRHPSTREYVRIAIILAAVTAAEVAIYYIDALEDVLIPMLYAFAVIKFTLVVLWFMHLRFDSRTYARFFLMGLAGAVTLFLIVLLIFGTFSR